jgi:WD40 repeat protein
MGRSAIEGGHMERSRRSWSVVIAPIITVAVMLAFFSADMWIPSVTAPFLPYQRIERPSDGFAISIPPDWEYAVPAEADPDEWWGSEQVDPAESQSEFLAEGGVLMTRQASPLAHHNCQVYDSTSFAAMPPAWSSLADAERDYSSWADDPEIVESETAYMDLPAGRALYVDTLLTDGWDLRAYVFTDDRSWFSVQCGTRDAPEDRWLSIAETFEFFAAAIVVGQDAVEPSQKPVNWLCDQAFVQAEADAAETGPIPSQDRTFLDEAIRACASVDDLEAAAALRPELVGDTDILALLIERCADVDADLAKYSTCVSLVHALATPPPTPPPTPSPTPTEKPTPTPKPTLAIEEEPAATGTFAPTGSLAEARVNHTATLLPDGRVLVVGGDASDASAEVWDPDSGTFSPAGSLAEARDLHTATVLADGRVLVVGGGGLEVEFLARAEVWDPDSGTFGTAGSLAEPRVGHTATLLRDGRVLVVGGLDDAYEELASAEVWDPVTGSFSPAGSLAEAHHGPTATLLSDGRVLVVGGRDDDYDVIASAEVWDPDTASFSPAGSLAEARVGHTASPLPDGRVLVVGGWNDDEDGSQVTSAEVWDPATATFAPTGSLDGWRQAYTATVLPDGRLLVIGGGGDDGWLASAEVWDPATSTFAPAASLTEPRGYHSATLLPDGRVLVVGGSSGAFLASAEVWDPDDG